MQNLCQYRRQKRLRFDLWVRNTPRAGHGNPFQYYCLGNPMDREAWQAMVHGVAQSRTWLSDLACTRMQKCAVTF